MAPPRTRGSTHGHLSGHCFRSGSPAHAGIDPGKADILAGLIYSIADNYLARIVGPRQIGDELMFLGGVALNRAVALALTARTGRRLVVPPHP